MPRITQLGRVMAPVSDQDEAIAFYTSRLGFSLAAGPRSRWCRRTAS